MTGSAVARAGVEPATFRFSGGRSYQLSYLAVARERATITISIVVGRPEPADEPNAGIPRPMDGAWDAWRFSATPTGLEPATSAVTGRRANQLRHGAFAAEPRTRLYPTVERPNKTDGRPSEGLVRTVRRAGPSG